LWVTLEVAVYFSKQGATAQMLLRNLMKPAALMIVLMVFFSFSFAQDTPSRVLVPGEPLVGILTEDAVAQVFSFTSVDAGNVSLQVTADEDLILSVVVTDAQGNQIAQATDLANSGLIGFGQIALPARGTYYVTVFPAAGTETLLEGQFTVLLEGEITLTTDNADATEESAIPTQEADATEEVAAPATRRVFQPGEILTTSGIQVSLSWETTSDLNLQIRDPVGRTLYFDSRTTNNGGEFGFDVNGLCEVLVEDGETATETATWTSGAVATGSYEILVFYRQDCQNVGAVPFTVNVTVDGQALDPIEATLQAPPDDSATVYLASFIINPNGSAQVGPEGEYTDTRVLPESPQTYLQAPATALQTDVVANGLITSDQYYQTYTFEGTANDVVTVSMTAQDGNLDTLLLVMDETGTIVADNDDIEVAVNTNSEIGNFRLPTTGTYTVLATRYGKDVGGTEGNYQLLLTGATNDLPQEVIDQGLPEGDIEVTLIWNTGADLQLLVRDPGGLVVFDDRTQISSGGTLVSTGNINCTPSATTPPTYYIYWPTGRARGGTYEVDIQHQGDCNDPTGVTATLYIEVGGELIAQTDIQMEVGDRYLTSFTVEGNSAVLSEGGIIGGLETIDFSTEQPVQISYGGARTGAITPQNKFDVYTFEGEAGDSVIIEMTRASGSLDTLLYLVGPDGFELQSNDDIEPGDNTNSRIPLTGGYVLPADGTYTIIATHFGTIFGGTTGGYSLTLTQFEQ
jgi:hypothetical protein